MRSTTLRGLALTAACFIGLAAPAMAQTVDKTVSSIYDNRALWTIEKTADASEIELSCGQTFEVDYEVTVRKTAQIMEQFPEGSITITNTTAGSLTLTDVDDIVGATSNAAIAVPLEVSCPVGLPYVMDPGEVVVCTYEGRIYEPTFSQVHNLNEAIATFGGGATAMSGQIHYNASPDGDPQLDACIEVSDDLEGPLGIVCFPAELEHTYNYTGTIGPFNTSGEFDVVNTASFFGQDSGPGGAPDPNPHPSTGSATGEASVTVTAIVECDGGGCSLTIGYWKTHSSYGPAAHPDPTWEELPGGMGPDTPFLNSGLSWIQMFGLSAAGGNAYIKLAQQWMGATLNVMAGADGGVLGTVLADAEALMTANPGCLGDPRSCPNGVRTQMNQWAEILDDYNNGELPGGPDHCDGEEVSGANALVGDGSSFALGTPAPNPTRGSSSIQFDVPEGSQVILIAYDVMGREVARLTDDYFEAGTHEVVFDGANLPAGTYFIRMSAGEFHDVTRVVLAR